MTTHHHTATLSWGGDTPTAELEVEVSYSVTWGAPEQGPSHAHGGQPADPDEIDNVKVISVDGKPWPVDMSYGFMSERETHDMLTEKMVDENYDAMIEAAVEHGAYVREQMMEYRREDR